MYRTYLQTADEVGFRPFQQSKQFTQIRLQGRDGGEVEKVTGRRKKRGRVEGGMERQRKDVGWREGREGDGEKKEKGKGGGWNGVTEEGEKVEKVTGRRGGERRRERKDREQGERKEEGWRKRELGRNAGRRVGWREEQG
jgi:hypothetical protein